ncbi:hypothetical protein BH09ACT7_BH09ACT7_34170 [soil metagenome]
MKRLFIVLALLAAGAAVVRSRQRVEVWHVAADQAVDQPA